MQATIDITQHQLFKQAKSGGSIRLNPGLLPSSSAAAADAADPDSLEYQQHKQQRRSERKEKVAGAETDCAMASKANNAAR